MANCNCNRKLKISMVPTEAKLYSQAFNKNHR